MRRFFAADSPREPRSAFGRPRLTRFSSRLSRIATAALAFTLATGTAVTLAPSAQAAGFERGPNPTSAILEASRGPFSVATTSVSSLVSGFGGGTIYYPTDTSQGTFGAIAISPGYTARWSSLEWLGPRIASHGFVVIGIETNSTLDQPASRGNQLLAALDYLVNSSSTTVRSRIDRNRLAVAGHSMGGGGTLHAAEDRPSLKAAVPIAPWNTDKTWGSVRVPTLIVAGESDSVASPTTHASPFYNSITQTEKAYLELNSASHFFPQTTNTPFAKQFVAWLKRWVDEDTRYSQFICPGPSGLAIEEYRSTCPV